MVEFINLFFVPIIAVNNIYNLENEEKRLDAKFIVRYMLCVVEILVCTYIIMNIAVLAVGIGGDTTSFLYMLASIVVSFIVPYINKIFEKYYDIKLEMKADKNENKKDS